MTPYSAKNQQPELTVMACWALSQAANQARKTSLYKPAIGAAILGKGNEILGSSTKTNDCCAEGQLLSNSIQNIKAIVIASGNGTAGPCQECLKILMQNPKITILKCDSLNQWSVSHFSEI